MYHNLSNQLSFHNKNDLYYITFPAFDASQQVRHCFSTRLGGLSQGPYQSLNLGLGRGDDDEKVYGNYKLLCEAIGINHEKLIFTNQIHDNHIKIIRKEDLEKYNMKNWVKGTDGLVTNIPNVPLVTLYADCVPLFFLDTKKKVIGLAHAGWRGTVKKIALRMIEIFINEFNSNPKDILAAIGPSIGKCCFEVDFSVADAFQKAFKNTHKIIFPIENEKFMIDLWEANKEALTEGGLPLSNITVTDLCTKCHHDIFFSYRADKGQTGRLAAVMELI
ncbi:MAG: peptidoglycan editing factor PgeF [Epulopiscium sp.]|jgi:YfiH family protein|nr:peptidoglycan editing factor PgeF [Candidatus Epulonipiscium sp.]HOQ15952.1 peptidoglycan editing factor PgeF [Defluviitaleaceae bacterium]HPT76224.1 peptidoglycan editing factor PgeF [Defluviitaleaceae bacterium]